MLPWCQRTLGRLRYEKGASQYADGSSLRHLVVELPGSSSWDNDGMKLNSTDSTRDLREALTLLAAVAHVNDAAWQYLLLEHCELDVNGAEEGLKSEFPPRFQLSLAGDGPDVRNDLLSGVLSFCGPEQHAIHSEEYRKTLAKIVSLWRENESAVSTEIEIPVTIQIRPWLTESAEDSLSYIRRLQQVVRTIRTHWQRYHDSIEAGFAFVFVLESIEMDLRDVSISVELAQLLGALARDGFRISSLDLRLELDDTLASNGKQAAARQAVGRLVTGLFGGARRSDAAVEWGNCEPTALTGPLAAIYGHSDQLAVESLSLDCEDIPKWVFERMCSALAVNQTTISLSLVLELTEDNEGRALCRANWQWIAFACFSEKARLSSRLEKLTLRNVVITVEAVEAIAAVLGADNPEEELLECTSIRQGPESVSILANAPIRLSPMHRNEILDGLSTQFTMERELNGVRLLDEEANGWVDVLVPGFGRCQTQRSSLRQREATLPPNGLAGVTSLVLSFQEDPEPEVLTGLLTLIGASLEYLTLDMKKFDTRQLEEIVANCPNLTDLAVKTLVIEARFCLLDRNYRDLKLPSTSHCSFQDIRGIAETLSDMENPLTKCIRRLRVRMNVQTGFYPSEDYPALLNMLQVNRNLEYLDIIAQRSHMAYFTAFKMHHLESLPVIQTEVPIQSKLAFLSIMTPWRHQDGANKQRKYQKPRLVSHLRELDEPLVASIFEFAATCVIRRVYFREQDVYQTGRYHVPI
ncbi:hypothetical protein BBJ28_00009885 [Nothophytophthora sp. Chile5]|nr:hypothetical protein BBJ28_00009885 [Nothophytophthora sp. Chile5]